MKRQRKKYETPFRPWDRERIAAEKELLKNFGLKNKREIWIAEALLRKYRRLGRELAAKRDKEREKILIEKLFNLGVIKNKEATLDDVLSLTVEDFLNRRLQTVVYKKNLTNTPKQARQFITHGKVLIGDRKVTYPSYMVPVDEKDKILVKISPVRRVVKGETNGTAG